VRLGFVGRFAAILLLCTIVVSATLSYAFARAHLDALKRDLTTTALGQASAALQPALERLTASRPVSRAERRRITAAITNIENFNPLVRSVELYRPNGQSLLMRGAPAVTADVQASIAQQNVIESTAHQRNGESVVTAYVPLAGSDNRYLAVAAIDVSVGQLEAQAGQETKFVILSTLFAFGVIFVSLLTLSIAAQRELDRRGRVAETTFLQTMEGIARIVDQRDPYTAGHSQRVAEYAAALAAKLGLSAKDIERVRWSSLLHDLGKIAIPDAVLLKPGPFTPAEREVINHHPSIAKDILGQVEAMAEIVPCVLHHHERWDGQGYPEGLAAEAIPLLSRVIAVADSFDAMTTDRPYRDALSSGEARRRLVEGAGSQWDQHCVAAMIALIDDGGVTPPGGQVREFGRRLRVAQG
jgi:putative nucleotidyltransferase with HDIG domain